LKQIDEFVDAFYINVSGKKDEINELKEEMKSHLYDAVHELKLVGKSEKEAVNIAIERFGNEEDMHSVLTELFRAQKLFAKKVLYTALAFILLPTLLFMYYYFSEKDYYSETDATSNHILQILGDKKTITEEMQKRIENVLNQKKFLFEIEIFDSKKLFSDGPEPAPSYQYKNDLNLIDGFLHKSHLGTGGYGNGNENWYMRIDVKSYDELLSNLILPMGIIVYWVLFAIWAIINSYHQRRLNIGWIFAFSLFNVIGYLIFYVVGKKKNSRFSNS
jgi:hypothetical protein